MALLIDIRDPEWLLESELRDLLEPHLPGVAIYCNNPTRPRSDVLVLAATRLYPGVAAALPNLKLVQKLGAGVDSIVTDPDLPSGVRVARLKPDAPAQEIAEYCVAYVLRDQRNLVFHARQEESSCWRQLAPRQTPGTTVGVLGLGHIGARTASFFAGLGFRVIGWSRSPKIIEGVECRYGDAALPALLAECDYVACILPSTAMTRDLFDAQMLGRMKQGAVIINAGRGDLIVEEALLTAIDRGGLGGAVLDVFREEPLPDTHPFWAHRKITVTPHVSGWHLDGGLEDVAENYRRILAGQKLLHQVDRQAGY